MKIVHFLLSGALAFCSLGSQAKVTTVDSIAANPGRAGGVYLAYPITDDSQVSFTKAPKGYKPFYVSHYGRHGSRFLINDADYLKPLEVLDLSYFSANLTPKGKELREKLEEAYLEAKGMGGELSPLGYRQHHDIARRLINNNPQIFEGEPEITAASTVIMRCAHSMFSFIESLKEVNPSLKIPMQSGNRTMDYLNYHSPQSNAHSARTGEWYYPLRNFKASNTNPDRLMKEIFIEPEYESNNLEPSEFMWDLYWVAVALQNMETEARIYDIFTPQELFDLWQVFNFQFYACNSSYPFAEGTHVDNAKNLLSNILTTADEYVADNKNGATLRFGHDGNIIPLAALLRFNDCYASVVEPEKLAEEYADYYISPMAANIQLIFYRNPSSPEILVKAMLNEREIQFDGLASDIFPFYRWSELRPHLQMLLDTPAFDFEEKVEFHESDGYEEFKDEIDAARRSGNKSRFANSSSQTSL